MVDMPKTLNFFFDLHKLIFDYMEEELNITEKDNLNFTDRVVTISLFVKRRQEELLGILKKYCQK